MTQSHRSKQTFKLLTKKSFGKQWKRKTIVLKKSVETPKTGELYISQPSKIIRKIYSGNAAVTPISPYSHAMVRGLSEDSMQNVLCLLKLQGYKQEDSPCQYFGASTQQEVSDLQKLGDAIQELCQVSTFPIDVQSNNGRIPAGPAYLHFGKNRVYLSSKTAAITILKEWQFHSAHTFQFEVRGIHIYDPDGNSWEEVFVSCRTNEDNRRIQQIISSQCSQTTAVPQVLPRPPSDRELSMLPPSSTSSLNNLGSSSLSTCSSETQSPSTPSIPESPVFPIFPNPESRDGFDYGSIDKVQKPILVLSQSSPLNKKTKQSPKHTVKEHVDIRFPITQKRSKSVSDLRLRQHDKEEVIILPMRAFSLDSKYGASILRQKPKGHQNKCITSSVTLHECLEEKSTEGTCDVNNNGENTSQGNQLNTFQEEGYNDSGTGAQALPPCDPKPEQVKTNKPEPLYSNGSDSRSPENNVFIDSPHYVNFETRPNCYMYQNISCLDDAPEIPKTYVNVFSGSSIKGCYENCHSGVYDHEFVYSSIDEISDVPPPVPKPRRPPPRLPPRICKDSHREMFPGKNFRKMNRPNDWSPDVPQRPPKRPPKSSILSTGNLSTDIKPNPQLPSDISNTSDIQTTPKIQVALFASPPTSGLVWFLRVAFMHQNENDTTFKRVKGIEEASNHRLVKSEPLEVFTDIIVALNALTKGFDLLNESQQEVESTDLDNLRIGDWFVIEFRVKQSDLNQVQFDGDVSVVPKAKVACRRACKVSFGISENFLITTPLTEKPMTTKPLKINFGSYEKLCKALDPITASSQDWRHVADALGFTREDIQSLVAKYHRNVYFSPTDAVLETWEQRDTNCSLKRLVNILRELERFDIVQDLGYSIEPEEKLNDGFKKI